jgi:imidazolonepropionase
MLIEDGVIEQVGPTRRVENLAAARDADEISAAGRVVMPGFVDSHTHMVFPPPGICGHDLEGAVRTVCSSTGHRIRWRTDSYLAAMARHGTTTVEAKTGCGPEESAELKLLRVLGALKDTPLHVVATFLFRLPRSEEGGSVRNREAVDWVLGELLPKIRRRRFARFADVAWESDGALNETYSRFLTEASRMGFVCKVHAGHESTAEAIAAAVRHLAVSVDHLEHASAEEVKMLAESGTMATLLPLTSFPGGRSAPARALIEAGIPVALASNFSPRHNPTMNMQTVVALARANLRMTTEEAIIGATINGAHALKRADRIGSLEAGKRADLLLLNTSDYRDVTHLFGTNIVHMTMRQGEVIYREGAVGTRE